MIFVGPCTEYVLDDGCPGWSRYPKDIQQFFRTMPMPSLIKKTPHDTPNDKVMFFPARFQRRVASKGETKADETLSKAKAAHSTTGGPVSVPFEPRHSDRWMVWTCLEPSILFLWVKLKLLERTITLLNALLDPKTIFCRYKHPPIRTFLTPSES